MSSPEADTTQYPPQPPASTTLPVPDPATASRDGDENGLVSSNPFGETNLSFLEREIRSRAWMEVTLYEILEDRVRFMANVKVLEPFLCLIRLFAIGTLPFRAVDCRYIPCSDDEYYFSVQASWRFEEEKELVLNALATALWQIPV